MTQLVIKQGMYKKAAQNPQPTFQQQFGILSNAIIIDKFPNLANYRVAFQLIDKNDQNTQALGVSVNRLDQQFIQIPSFFNNGKIKTGDMMYIPSIQMFRPLSDAWLADTRSMKLAQPGQVYPAQLASVGTDAPGSVRVKQDNDPIVKAASITTAASSSEAQQISIFDTAIKMGKTAALNLLRAMQDSEQVGRAALRFYGQDSILNFAKQAAAFIQIPTATQQVITVMDKRAALLTEDQKQQLYRDGYIIKTAAQPDTRPSRQVLKVEAFDRLQSQFVAPTGTYTCKLIDPEGQLHDAIVLVPTVLNTDEDHRNGYLAWQDHDNMLKQRTTKYVVAPGEFAYNVLAKDAMAKANTIKPISVTDIGAELGSSVQEIPCGSLFVLPDGQVCELHPTGLTKAQGKCLWTEVGCVGQAISRTLSLAQDDKLKKPIISSTGSRKYNIVMPRGTRVVFPSGYTSHGTFSTDERQRCTASPELARCGRTSLRNVLQAYRRKNFDKLKVYTQGSSYVISDDDGDTQPLQVKQAALRLVRDHGIAPQVAKSMLADTLMGAKYDRPNRNTYLVRKVAALSDPEQSNIGKTTVSNAGPQTNQISLDDFKQDPAQLMQSIQRATQYGIKQVFDVTMLKLLAQTSDISEHIDDFVQDFLRSLDKLCRMLFVLYWHGDIMQKKYGMLKLRALQESIKNSIDSLSDLTVFLKIRGFGGTSSTYVTGGELTTGEML